MHSPYHVELCPVWRTKIIQARMQDAVSERLGPSLAAAPFSYLTARPSQQAEGRPACGVASPLRCGHPRSRHRHHYRQQNPLLHLAGTTTFDWRFRDSPTQSLAASTGAPSLVQWGKHVTGPRPINALHPLATEAGLVVGTRSVRLRCKERSDWLSFPAGRERGCWNSCSHCANTWILRLTSPE